MAVILVSPLVESLSTNYFEETPQSESEKKASYFERKEPWNLLQLLVYVVWMDFESRAAVLLTLSNTLNMQFKLIMSFLQEI